MAWLRGLPLAMVLASLIGNSVAHADNGQRPLTPGGATSKNPFTDEFAKFVEETLDEWKVPGLSIAVIDGDDIYAEGYGYATLPHTKATPETLWYAGSTTKAFAAATLAHLIDSKNYSALSLGWSTPISSIIRDDFVVPDEWATNHLTLEDAVSHRTGMGRHDLSLPQEVNGKQTTVKDIVRSMRHLPSVSAPRTKFYYCNLMYVTLSYVIETITGQWLGDVLKQTIWEPLGMKSTYFHTQDAIDAPEHLSTGYYWDDKEKTYKSIPNWVVDPVSGAGAIISNVIDYAKWVKCLLHEDAPFSETTHKDIKTPRMIASELQKGQEIYLYGLGWIRTHIKGHVLYTHNGGTIGHGAAVFWLPDSKYGVVALGNTAGTSNTAEEVLIYHLIEEKLGVSAGDNSDANERSSSDQEDTVNMDQDVDEAVGRLYPHRPHPALPSTLNTTQLQGQYYDPGYGPLDLHEELHKDQAANKKILVASRSDVGIRYKVSLHHASGDYWAARVVSTDNPTLLDIFLEASFEIGPDGKATALKVTWPDGPVLYKRDG